jgi:UDP-N-acetylglucosamine diphosphorylase/glucosamine-1-phosphate N-acetyltransferase
MTRTLLLFDDKVARAWHPFALTRPVGELLFGALLLRERVERTSGVRVAGYLPTPGLEGFEERDAPSVVDPYDLPGHGTRILLSSRYVAARADGAPDGPFASLDTELPEGGVRLVVGEATAGWALSAEEPSPSRAALLDPGGAGSTIGRGGAVKLSGRLLESPWQLVSENARQIAEDLDSRRPGGERAATEALRSAAGVHLIRDDAITVEAGVQVDPLVVLDASGGPIHLSRGVRVHAFTHVVGPAFIGPETLLMGGTFEALSCGPVCKLHGEIAESIVLGFSNKAHDGYLGHSIVGRWANLGALTTNSDLKNNYGPVRVGWEGGATSTGMLKLGALLGDHVKTGIGTMLSAGTVVGAGTNLFGRDMPPKWVSAFCWGRPGVPHRLEAFLETAERVMARRDVPLTPAQRTFLGAAWHSIQGSTGAGRGR